MNFFEDFKSKCSSHHSLVATFVVTALAFLVVLTLFVGVGVINKIKAGKYIGQDVVSKNTITVSATGEVYARPDLAMISFSVVTEGETADATMKENSQKMNVIIEVIKNRGVEAKDLKTTNFSITPRYEWHKNGKTYAEYQPTGERVLAGYDVQQTLEVKIRDLDKIGDVIRAATVAGSNQMGGLQFTIDKQDEFVNQARQDAIKKAKVKAKELASQLNVDLGKIINFSEGGVYPRLYESKAMGIGGGDMTFAPAPNVEVGENKIEVTVNITYEIN